MRATSPLRFFSVWPVQVKNSSENDLDPSTNYVQLPFSHGKKYASFIKSTRCGDVLHILIPLRFRIMSFVCSPCLNAMSTRKQWPIMTLIRADLFSVQFQLHGEVLLSFNLDLEITYSRLFQCKKRLPSLLLFSRGFLSLALRKSWHSCWPGPIYIFSIPIVPNTG